jgi:hypothetical protein
LVIRGLANAEIRLSRFEATKLDRQFNLDRRSDRVLASLSMLAVVEHSLAAHIARFRVVASSETFDLADRTKRRGCSAAEESLSPSPASEIVKELLLVSGVADPVVSLSISVLESSYPPLLPFPAV